MGLGDELLAAGEARRMRRTDPRKVRIIDRRGIPRWHEVWDGCPDIARTRDTQVQVLRNGPGCRPYIDYPRSTPQRWGWTNYRPEPAQLGHVKANEAARGCVLIEPHIKSGASPNKQWGKWHELVKRPFPWLQVGPRGTTVLPGARFIETNSIREAQAALTACAAAVLPEGGLHHLAAAVGLRAVVLFGGYIGPEQTGYEMHRNIFTGVKACGSRLPCEHCRVSMSAITVHQVVGELEGILR